jgi:hypothetical protein
MKTTASISTPKIEYNSKEYNDRKYSIMLDFCPTIYPCKKCGAPVAQGYCCTYCRTSNPSLTEDQEKDLE